MATLVSWSREQVSDDDHQFAHRLDLMTLDDIAKINHLTELVESIRRGNPRSYYLALREDEIHNLRRVMQRPLNKLSSYKSSSSTPQGSFFARDSSARKGSKEVEEIFDTNQIKLI
jgi:hypothetical protein